MATITTLNQMLNAQFGTAQPIGILETMAARQSLTAREALGVESNKFVFDLIDEASGKPAGVTFDAMRVYVDSTELLTPEEIASRFVRDDARAVSAFLDDINGRILDFIHDNLAVPSEDDNDLNIAALMATRARLIELLVKP